MQAPDTLLVACGKCGMANRVPRLPLADAPNCGVCHAPLLEGKPVELDAARFEPFLSRNSLPVELRHSRDSDPDPLPRRPRSRARA